jgi:hypothetical protein
MEYFRLDRGGVLCNHNGMGPSKKQSFRSSPTKRACSGVSVVLAPTSTAPDLLGRPALFMEVK